MNCETFLDRLHEYLDETLDADVESSARLHLAQCPNCRRALQREQTLAIALRTSLERATADVFLRPQLRQNVLRALEPTSIQSNGCPAWLGFIFRHRRWIASTAIVLTVLLLFIGLHFDLQRASRTVAKTVAPPAHYTWVVTVPLQTQTHVFRRQDNTIEDGVISGTSVGYASFSDDRQSTPQQSPSPHPL